MAIATQSGTEKPETYIKFRGMKAGTDVDTPQLGDHQEFIVIAECVQVGTEQRADGERRPVVGMRVLEVRPGEIKAAPRDEQLPFDQDDVELTNDLGPVDGDEQQGGDA